MALEVIEGQVQFSFSLGANITKVVTKLPKAVNDGNWHQVAVDYLNRVCVNINYQIILLFINY